MFAMNLAYVCVAMLMHWPAIAMAQQAKGHEFPMVNYQPVVPWPPARYAIIWP